ncbi:unnamed protein product [Brassicogethes aeneus]|uniref:Uncharacterized protein n=1 Tax=Brassicogethes aeneus TaxID=1431903 RepID=A0A9P0FLW8_BRAAE|nr:unnamed protein product [Brassicogethes aeneus]
MSDSRHWKEPLTMAQLLEELENDSTPDFPTDIIIFPPENANENCDTDEDSGAEDDVVPNNLPGVQLRAPAEIEVDVVGDDDADSDDDLPLAPACFLFGLVASGTTLRPPVNLPGTESPLFCQHPCSNKMSSPKIRPVEKQKRSFFKSLSFNMRKLPRLKKSVSVESALCSSMSSVVLEEIPKVNHIPVLLRFTSEESIVYDNISYLPNASNGENDLYSTPVEYRYNNMSNKHDDRLNHELLIAELTKGKNFVDRSVSLNIYDKKSGNIKCAVKKTACESASKKGDVKFEVIQEDNHAKDAKVNNSNRRNIASQSAWRGDLRGAACYDHLQSQPTSARIDNVTARVQT